MTDFMSAFRSKMVDRHTSSQIPLRGKRVERRPEDRPIGTWYPSSTDVVRFLIETKKVHKALRAGVHENTRPEYLYLRDVEMGTVAAMDRDIACILLETDADPVTFYSPGKQYATYLNDLARTEPTLFLAHYYAIYFAHASGGGLIGRRVEDVLSLSLPLETYQYPKSKDLNDMKDHMYSVSSKWSSKECEKTVEEVDTIFAYANRLLRILAFSSITEDHGLIDM